MSIFFYEEIKGVPDFLCIEYEKRQADYCVLIPVINEGTRVINELKRAYKNGIHAIADIIICDGDSTDNSTEENILSRLGVNTLLVKKGPGKQGAQLRMGIYYALKRKYCGIITIDGNNKDSIEDIPNFIHRLKEGYDFVQGSRFIKGGKAINTPVIRYLSVRLIHAPIISLTAGHWYTDTTNAFRAYSSNYLIDKRVQPLRDIFNGYELLAYLSVRAAQIHMRTCEIPVTREYPRSGKIPTKISTFNGNVDLFLILIKNFIGLYNPVRSKLDDCETDL